jgi:hypothetical protein
MLKEDILPLALYRNVSSISRRAFFFVFVSPIFYLIIHPRPPRRPTHPLKVHVARGVDVSFIFTNPNKTTHLQETDR